VKVRACLWVTAFAFASGAFSGCGSQSGSSGVMSEDQVVSFCDDLIGEIEQDSSPTQLEGFDDVKQYVADYTFQASGILGPLAPPPPEDPTIIEPENEAGLYRMVGVLALFNGNLAASTWASAQAARLAPADSGSLSQLGVGMIENQRCKDAERLLKTAKSHDTQKNELIRLSLGSAYACQNKADQAQQEIAEALDIAPDSVMAREAMMEYRAEKVDYIVGLEDSLYAQCENDINQALQLSSSQACADFTQQKQAEVQVLSQQMMTLLMNMPPDVPPDLIVTITDLQDETYQKDDVITNKLNSDTDDAQTAWEDGQDQLSLELGDCCQAASQPCCACFKYFCSGCWGFLMNTNLPAEQAALATYLQNVLQNLVDGELKTTGALMQAFPDMSDAAVSWTASLVYNGLSVDCKRIALGVNIVQTQIHAMRDVAQAHCEATQQVCQTQEYLSEWEAKQQELEDAAQAVADAIDELAKSMVDGQNNSLKGEISLDDLGSLGIDGGALSLKIGGPVFAKFTVDFANLSIGIRAGVGISDPTGGNIAGADLSVGGEVGVDHTSFDISHSQSAVFGTYSHTTPIFKSTFKF
jgi:tetratricopeptide (TPR) repeat protein